MITQSILFIGLQYGQGKASCHCSDANLARFLMRFQWLWMKKAVQRTQNKPPQMLHGLSGCLHLGHFGNTCVEYVITNYIQLSTIEKSLLSNKACRTFFFFSGSCLDSFTLGWWDFSGHWSPTNSSWAWVRVWAIRYNNLTYCSQWITWSSFVTNIMNMCVCVCVVRIWHLIHTNHTHITTSYASHDIKKQSVET